MLISFFLFKIYEMILWHKRTRAKSWMVALGWLAYFHSLNLFYFYCRSLIEGRDAVLPFYIPVLRDWADWAVCKVHLFQILRAKSKLFPTCTDFMELQNNLYICHGHSKVVQTWAKSTCLVWIIHREIKTWLKSGLFALCETNGKMFLDKNSVFAESHYLLA